MSWIFVLDMGGVLLEVEDEMVKEYERGGRPRRESRGRKPGGSFLKGRLTASISTIRDTITFD